MGDYLQLSTNYPLGEAAATIFAFQKSGRPRLIRLFYHHPGFRKQPGAAKRRQCSLFPICFASPGLIMDVTLPRVLRFAPFSKR